MDYKITFIISFLLAFIATPIFRFIAIKLNVLDHPVSDVKTHKQSIPYFGGLAIAGAFFITLILVRLTTSFPTGTLKSLRGIFYSGFIVLMLGLFDDIKYKGIHFSTKFLGEIIVAIIVIFYGIKINFITPEWFAIIITFIWIIGMINAFNIIDVIDGLSSGICLIATLFFFLLGSFGEEEIYVNYVSITLAGACLGFLPYNLSKKYKIFMGDTGSLFIGLIVSTIALGTKYSSNHNLGVLSPVIILFVPIYDTLLVSILRLKKGISPFLGSKDHFALRLENVGLSRKQILLISYFFGIIFGFVGYLIKTFVLELAIVIVFLWLMLVFIISKFLVKINIE
ncbi:MAG: MraY family glycosyltransferase [Endomicrobiia bacterium]